MYIHIHTPRHTIHFTPVTVARTTRLGDIIVIRTGGLVLTDALATRGIFLRPTPMPSVSTCLYDLKRPEMMLKFD